MGFDTHMVAGSRACSTSTPPTHPTITNETSPHYAEALATHGPEHGPGGRRIHRHEASTSDPAPTRCRNRTELSGVGAACGCFT